MTTHLPQSILLMVLFIGLFGSARGAEHEDSQRSLVQLEERLAAIDSELGNLARSSLRGGVGNLGWISQMDPDGPRTEWLTIDFGESVHLDEIILVPVIWRDGKTGYETDGFPREFKVIAGTADDENSFTIVEYGPDNPFQPRVAPLVIPVADKPVSWIRIEGKTEASRVWDGKYTMQLAEVLAFRNGENLALNNQVSVSSAHRNWVPRAAYRRAAVDGLLPYLMDAADGAGSDPYIAFYRGEQEFAYTIDLENEVSVNEVHLHAADIRENSPRIHHPDYGMPKHLRIEGANKEDFSDAVKLVEFKHETVYETGPILMFRFAETTCRYIRVTAVKGYRAPEAGEIWQCYGLAEIDVLSAGTCVSVGKQASASIEPKMEQGKLENLTDGRNHFGELLSIHRWLNELARRYALENERPQVVAYLANRYAKQKLNLRMMYWISGVLGGVLVLTFLLNRMYNMHQVAKIKERFAADLHDELGANLHAIGLLSDVAKDAKSLEEWQRLSKRVRELAIRSGTAVKHCSNMLEAKNLYIGLAEDIRRTSQRIATNLECVVLIEGEEYLEGLKARDRVDLFLFYKECLVNVCRHSGASKVDALLKANARDVLLEVNDNGMGIHGDLNGKAPNSLRRRARLLGGKVEVEKPSKGGTCVRLSFRPNRFRFSLFRRMEPASD